MSALVDLEGTDVNCKDDRGRTLISCILENLNEQSMESLNLLLQRKKADPNVPDLQSFTPLHYACQKVRTDVRTNYALIDHAREAQYLRLIVIFCL